MPSSVKMKPKAYPTGPRGFLLWMRERNPKLYNRAMPRIRSPRMLAGLGIADPATLPVESQSTSAATPGWASAVQEILKTAGTAYLTSQQLKAQQSILNTQLKRAQMGLAPLDIDMSQYGATPQIGIDTGTKNVLMLIAAGLGAVYLVPKLLRR